MIDLHIHSQFSADATGAPRDILTQARKKGLRAVSITDHDTVQGVQEAQERSVEVGIDFLGGVEVGAYCDSRGKTRIVHVLGYFFGDCPSGVTALAKAREVKKKEYLDLLLAGLGKLNIPMTREMVLKAFPGRDPSTVHVRHLMRDMGYARDKPESIALERNAVAAAGHPGLVEEHPLAETLAALKAAGAVAILAHPFDLVKLTDPIADSECWEIVSAFLEMGGDGVEAYHTSPRTHQKTEELVAFARKRRCLISGGADCHNATAEGGNLGSLDIPYAVFKELKNVCLRRGGA